MLRKQLATAIGLSSLLACGTASAQAFSFTEFLQLGASLPDITNNVDLSQPRGVITLSDGSTMTVRTLNDSTSLSDALASSDAKLLVNDNEVTLGTSSTSLASAYDNKSQSATFTFAAVTGTRQIELEWTGPLDAVENSSTYNAKLNGNTVSLELPAGTSLADLDDNTPIVIRNEEGKIILQGSLNSITSDQINQLASELGALNADKSLSAAQKHAMAQTFGILSEQIDVAMAPGNRRLGGGASSDASRFSFGENLNAWVSTEVGDISGDSAGLTYEGNSKAALFGVDKRMENALAGVAVGYSKFELTSRFGNSDLSGNMIAPYGAMSLLNGNLVLSGILLYQDLEGEYAYGSAATNFDGDRLGARGAGTYYLPRFGSNDTLLAGLTLGAAYLDDSLDDDNGNDYGAELGEAFAGARLSADLGAGNLYGSVTYFEDITSDFNSRAEVLENEDGNRTELKIGATHQLGTNMNFNISAKTTVGSSDTEYTSVQAAMAYRF